MRRGNRVKNDMIHEEDSCYRWLDITSSSLMKTGGGGDEVNAEWN